jgi:hypothetical protein
MRYEKTKKLLLPQHVPVILSTSYYSAQIESV